MKSYESRTPLRRRRRTQSSLLFFPRLAGEMVCSCVATSRPRSLRRNKGPLGFSIFHAFQPIFFLAPLFLNDRSAQARVVGSTKSSQLSFRIVHFVSRQRTFLIRRARHSSAHRMRQASVMPSVRARVRAETLQNANRSRRHTRFANLSISRSCPSALTSASSADD